MSAGPGILFLTESFHPVLGGGEGHIRTLGARLVQGGQRIGVVTRRGERSWAAEEELDGMRVVRVAPAGPGRSGKYAMVPGALAALARERGRYAVLVVRGTRVLGLPGLVAGRALGKAVVMQAEVNGEMSGEVYTWGTRLERGPGRALIAAAAAARNTLLRDADAFVAMSRRICDEMLEARIPRERVALIPHGVDTVRFRPAAPGERQQLRRRLDLPQAGVLLVFTGRLLRGKGLETLLDAFAALTRTRPEVHLAIVGSGEGQALSVEAALRRRVESEGIGPRVTFTGRVANVEDYLRAGDVFAFPSVFEALGLSLIEAAACGLPAVGCRTGGIVDVIEDGSSGLLVEPGDARGLAAALLALVRDASLRAALGDAARRRAASRFALEDSVERYRALFGELAARRRAGGLSSPCWDACWPARAPRGGAARPR